MTGQQTSARQAAQGPLEAVRLVDIMAAASGLPDVVVGLIDGPVAIDHAALDQKNIRLIATGSPGCKRTGSSACIHGTFIAGILHAARGSGAPGICRRCTLALRPLFTEAGDDAGDMPSAVPEELAAAIIETVDAGADVLNLSVGLADFSCRDEREVEDALDYALSRDTIVVAAAGNQGTLGSSAIVRHPAVIPVVATDLRNKPLLQSNLGASIGRRGLSAPGKNVVSLRASGGLITLSGTSVAAPFVTGCLALLRSLFVKASGVELRHAVTRTGVGRRSAVVPPSLNASGAHAELARMYTPALVP